MKAGLFAAGLILVFIAWAINQLPHIPWPSISYWEPYPGWKIPILTLQWVNPLGFLVYPLILIGAILTVFGLTENDKIRVVLSIIIFIAVYLMMRGLWHLPI